MATRRRTVTRRRTTRRRNPGERLVGTAHLDRAAEGIVDSLAAMEMERRRALTRFHKLQDEWEGEGFRTLPKMRTLFSALAGLEDAVAKVAEVASVVQDEVYAAGA
jgi:hypothetical protein